MAVLAEPVVLSRAADAIHASEQAAHARLTRELFSMRLQEKLEVIDGYAFRFPLEALAAVERFVWNERRACPFLAFEIRLTAAQAVWLKMTGPAGTPAFLDAAFDLPATTLRM